MELLIQATINVTVILACKGKSLVLGSEEKTILNNLIQAMNEATEPNKYAIT